MYLQVCRILKQFVLELAEIVSQNQICMFPAKVMAFLGLRGSANAGLYSMILDHGTTEMESRSDLSPFFWD